MTDVLKNLLKAVLVLLGAGNVSLDDVSLLPE